MSVNRSQIMYNLINNIGKTMQVNTPAVIIFGDQGPGKTTVVNRLLGVDVSPARKSGDADLNVAKTTRPLVYKMVQSDKSTIQFGTAAAVPLEGAIGSRIADHVAELSKTNGYVTVTISGPKFSHMNIIDMPGLHQPGSEFCNNVKSAIVAAHALYPNATWVFVSSAGTPPSTSLASEYLARIDPEKLVWVITKPDLIDRNDPTLVKYFDAPPMKMLAKNICIVKSPSAWDKEVLDEAGWFSAHPMYSGKPEINMGIKKCHEIIDAIVFRGLKANAAVYKAHSAAECYRLNKQLAVLHQYDTKEQRLVKAGEIWKKFITVIDKGHSDLIDSILRREDAYPGTKITLNSVDAWFAGKVSDVQDGLGDPFRLALIELATPPVDVRFNGYEETVLPACGYIPSILRCFIMKYLIKSRVAVIRGCTEQEAAIKLEPLVHCPVDEVKKAGIVADITRNTEIISLCREIETAASLI